MTDPQLATVYGGSEPTDEQIVEGGSWDPRYTRVVATALLPQEGIAVAVIDTNADEEPYHYVDVFCREDDGWRCAGGSNAGNGGSGWLAGVSFAYGPLTGHEGGIVVELQGVRYDVPAQNGWWLFAIGRPEYPEEEPQLVSYS